MRLTPEQLEKEIEYSRGMHPEYLTVENKIILDLADALEAERKAHDATCKERDELNAAHLYAIAGEKSAHEDYDKKCEELEAERKARREAEEDARTLAKVADIKSVSIMLTPMEHAARDRIFALAAGEGKA